MPPPQPASAEHEPQPCVLCEAPPPPLVQVTWVVSDGTRARQRNTAQEKGGTCQSLAGEQPPHPKASVWHQPLPPATPCPRLLCSHPHRAHEGLEQVLAEQAQGGWPGEQHNVWGALQGVGVGGQGAASRRGWGRVCGELTSMREQ